MSTTKEIFSQSATKEEYSNYLSALDLSLHTKSDSNEIEMIEDILELRRGVLKNEDYYVNESTCPGCGKKITFYDFVKTAVDESTHSKSFLVHALLGNKYGFQTPRTIRCSSCNKEITGSIYTTPAYSCRER